jgi:hypothetical protein
MSPVLTRFLERLPAEQAVTFSADQLSSIELHFGMRYRKSHAIDWRQRIRLPFLRCYIVLLAGRDERVT